MLRTAHSGSDEEEMKNTTEKERAEFAKAWAEFEALHESDAFPMGARTNKERAWYWWLQAARRAPVVPEWIEPIETIKYWRDAYANPQGDEHFMGHGVVVKIFDDYLAMINASSSLRKCIEISAEFIENAPVYSGVCCCGDGMDGHASAMTCGHVAVDQWDYAMRGMVDELRAMLSSTPQPPEAGSQPPFQTEVGEAAPVQLPEPDAWRYPDARGNFRYRGRRVGFGAEYPLLKPEPLYTEQQVRQLLATHGAAKR